MKKSIYIFILCLLISFFISYIIHASYHFTAKHPHYFTCYRLPLPTFSFKKLQNEVVIDKIEVFKSKRKMKVYNNGKLLKTYQISLGKEPIGHKEKQGDFKTPEGLYNIKKKNKKGYSVAHMSLLISYPNLLDKKNANQNHWNPGGSIVIHGFMNNKSPLIGYLGHLFCSGWTDGCIGVTNSEVEEIYAHTPLGTQIEINP